MTLATPGEVSHVREVIYTAVEDVFASVGQVHDMVLDCDQAAREREKPLCGADVSALRKPIRELLHSPDMMAVGLGFIVAPKVLVDQALRLEWWQTATADGVSAPLEVDLDPQSLRFYDYPGAEWFAGPRRSGRRHVVGPYVDVYGTARYVLTLTMPVVADERFLGVVGADVPVNRFEARLLRDVSLPDVELVVVNEHGRVVLSTSPHCLTGSLLSQDVDGRDPVTTDHYELDNLPWRLRLTDAPTPSG